MATSATPARFTDSGRSLPSVIRRYARWSLVARRQRPSLFVTYVLLPRLRAVVALSTLAMLTRCTRPACG